MIACTRQKEPLTGVLKMLENLVKFLISNSGKVLGLYLRKISSQIKLQASSFGASSSIFSVVCSNSVF